MKKFENYLQEKRNITYQFEGDNTIFNISDDNAHKSATEDMLNDIAEEIEKLKSNL